MYLEDWCWHCFLSDWGLLTFSFTLKILSLSHMWSRDIIAVSRRPSSPYGLGVLKCLLSLSTGICIFYITIYSVNELHLETFSEPPHFPFFKFFLTYQRFIKPIQVTGLCSVQERDPTTLGLSLVLHFASFLFPLPFLCVSLPHDYPSFKI